MDDQYISSNPSNDMNIGITLKLVQYKFFFFFN